VDYDALMALPAFLSPAGAEDAAIPTLTPEIDEACSALWDQAQRAWSARPHERSEAEDVALGATFGLMLEISRALAEHPQAALRAYVNEGLRRVVREQRATAEDDRAFALRQLEQALEHYGVIVETLAFIGGFDDVLVQALQVAGELEHSIPDELRPLYRAHGALLMAFEALGEDRGDELRYWARQAVERWRGVVAGLPSVGTLVRGARAHVRARRAWDSWTDEDGAVEREAWKGLR
jgi:hypothetical protein